MGKESGKESEPAAVSKVFRSAVQEKAAIVKWWTLVVVQQTFLPDFPRFCVLQLGYGSVEKGDGGSWFIVFSHPVYRLVNTIRSGVQQTFTKIILRMKTQLSWMPSYFKINITMCRSLSTSLHRAPMRQLSARSLSARNQVLVQFHGATEF